MLAFTTVGEARAYSFLYFPAKGNVQDYTCEEYAHKTVHTLCCLSSMTMELLYTILYRVTNKYPYSVEPCVHAVYEQYLQAMQLGTKT